MNTDTMPSALIEVPVEKVPVGPSRKRWTRPECARLEASGLLDQQNLELVEGELIDKIGKNRPHVNGLSSMYAWLIEVFGKRFVNPEAPIDVSPEDNPSNEPEPDLIVLNQNFFNFRSANPGPQDLLLVVEVADTTLHFDLTVKAAIYARAGIVEYWVLDVSGRRLIVHRHPQSGGYASILVYSEQESVAPLAAPHAMFKAADAFPE
jgi:Uma2 family endonuclease